jgi:hypothetical protein
MRTNYFASKRSGGFKRECGRIIALYQDFSLQNSSDLRGVCFGIDVWYVPKPNFEDMEGGQGVGLNVEVAGKEFVLFLSGHSSSYKSRRRRRPVDTLVYELYGLTEEEIKVIEGRTESQ